MEKKRVLMVHNFYQIGGGEHTVFENEKNLLMENGHEVYTYTRSNDELKKSKWKLLLLPFSTVWSFKSYREVRKIIKKKNIDIVHCHNTFPLISPSVYYAARSLKVPVVQTIHNFRFLCPNGLFYCNGEICEKCRESRSFLPALKNGCYRNSKIQTAVAVAMLRIHRLLGTYRKINYIFLTKFNRDKFSEIMDIHGDNVFIKPNFVQRPVEESKRNIAKKFLYIGRLDQYKGIRFILKAWSSLPEAYELHIYGDGECRDICEEAAQKYPNIHFFGYRAQNKIFEDLRQASALLFPSVLYEGFPMTLAESFGLGTPVVAVNIGNHADIVRSSGGGVLYESESVESFCHAIEDIMSHREAYSKEATAFYNAQLTREKNYEKLCEIYDKAKYI